MFDTWIKDIKPAAITGEGNRFEIMSGGKTNYFVNPMSGSVEAAAPVYAKKMDGNFTITCLVRPFLNTVYDAGALMLYVSDHQWVKFAVENTDIGYPSVVSVVTNGVSDDANGERVDTKSVRLRMSKKGPVVGLYYSPDGTNWKMVRLFRMETGQDDDLYVGLETQSPIGDGCTVIYEDVTIIDRAVHDLRKGR